MQQRFTMLNNVSLNKDIYRVLINNKRSFKFIFVYTKLVLSCLFSKDTNVYFTIIFKILILIPVIMICVRTALIKELMIIQIFINNNIVAIFSINHKGEIGNLYLTRKIKSFNTLKKTIIAFNSFLSSNNFNCQLYANVVQHSSIENFLKKSGFLLDKDYINYLITVEIFKIIRFSYFSSFIPKLGKFKKLTILRKWNLLEIN